MKVYMAPEPEAARNQVPSGIQTVILNYAAYAPYYKIEFVSDPEDADVVAIHAGTRVITETRKPTVAHCHGLYWTADYKADPWEFRMNRDVIDIARRADVVTVPSNWVAQTFQRDMHLNPVVLPHGITLKEWSPQPAETPYILWNKNRASDACDPVPVQYLSDRFPDNYFMSTHIKDPGFKRPNLKVTGTLPHADMRIAVQGAHIYLATTKETFGIGTLEALASGVPVLGFNWGGTKDIVQHGINGYLAEPYDYKDLEKGLHYCLENRRILSANALLRAQDFKWNAVMRQLKATYELAIERFNKPHSVSVVIPCFNKQETIVRAVRSVIGQTLLPDNLVIVNNNSTDNSYAEATALQSEVEAAGVKYVITNCPVQGVAHARNWGIGLTDSRYISCLDGDDEIAPEFLERCVDTLRNDTSVGMAYTKLVYIDHAKDKELPQSWPGEFDFDKFIIKQNQVPTCCVFRHDLWDRLGGFRQRYSPDGAGAEDAELWLRIAANGYKGKLASNDTLFRYHSGGQTQTDTTYAEEDWLYWHPWVKDKQHPFASPATPIGNLSSHPVRAYDRPIVSVIIPCTRSHLRYLIDAIDSLEAQTLRQWEAIVVLDFLPLEGEVESLLSIYPFIRVFSGGDKVSGAGRCRNIGVDNASAPLITYLDADDWMEPGCLFSLVQAYKDTGEFAYSDYYGHAVITPEVAQSAERSGHLKAYYKKRGEAIIIHHAMDYDCARAQNQPNREDHQKFYIWNIVTTLITKEAHYAIGGFDEKMTSYEDWDYWLRMARQGYCFVHVTESLVNYRFYTGSRRETGRQNHDTLLDYLSAKYKGEPIMACRGCKGGRTKVAANPATVFSPQAMTQRLSNVNLGEERSIMSAEDMVTIKLLDGNTGEHPIVVRDPKTQKSMNYGYRRDGEEFLMHRHIAALYPTKYIVQEGKKVETATVATEPTGKPATPPPPNLNTKISNVPTPDLQANLAPPIQAESDLGQTTPPSQDSPEDDAIPTPSHSSVNWTEWGMTELQAKKLSDAGVDTISELIKLSPTGLRDLADMSKNKAEEYLGKAIAQAQNTQTP